MNYTANFNYFDNITTPEQSYWLGFIWADGYVAKRIRPLKNNKTKLEYNLKLDIKKEDANHIQKLLDCLDSNYPVHFYKTKGFFAEDNVIARAFLTNKHMCSFLYEDLGIVPYRVNAEKVIHHIPQHLHKYFILGLLDADGSFTAYSSENYGQKLNVSFGGSASLMRFIEQHLISNGIVKEYNGGRKLSKRHEEKDGDWISLRFSGRMQGKRVLDYLYDSPIYLDRKYKKYLEIPYKSSTDSTIC